MLDTETTGLSKIHDRLVEIAAVKFVNCEPTEKFVTLINPGMRIPEEAVSVHHITNQMVRNAPCIETVLPQVLEFIGDRIIVAHNAHFDIGFLEMSARRLGYDPCWNYVDTISVARKVIPSLMNYQQGTVLRAIGYQQAISHRAEEDCLGCAQILITALRKLG